MVVNTTEPDDAKGRKERTLWYVLICKWYMRDQALHCPHCSLAVWLGTTCARCGQYIAYWCVCSSVVYNRIHSPLNMASQHCPV